MYIDGVFSGGGIKGIALIGAIEEIENRGYQFKRVAVQVQVPSLRFLAAKYTSKEMDQLLDELNLKLLLDERKTILPYSVAKWMLVYFRLGLYKGNALENWISEVLARKGLHTFSDLPRHQLRFIASILQMENDRSSR